MSTTPPSFARANSSGVDYAYEYAPTPTCPPPLQRSVTTACSSYYPEPPLASTPPPPLQRSMTSNCCSHYPEPPLLRRTDTSADYARGDDTLARLSRLERDSLRIQQELADLSYRIRASLPVVPPLDSPVRRQIASPAPAPAPAHQISDASSPHYPFSVATVEMMNNFGM